LTQTGMNRRVMLARIEYDTQLQRSCDPVSLLKRSSIQELA
jgi:hypothetical protein